MHRRESRFGQTIGGDFFDLIDLGDGKRRGHDRRRQRQGRDRVGHDDRDAGLPARRAARHARPGASRVAATHAFLGPRRPTDKFVTAWVGVIDLNAGTLTLRRRRPRLCGAAEARRRVRLLEEGGGPPIGMVEECDYEAAEVAVAGGLARCC